MKKKVWWINPGFLVLFFMIPIYIGIFLFTSKSTVIGSTQNYFSIEYFILGLLFLMVFCMGVFLSFLLQNRRTIGKISYKYYFNSKYLDILAVLTIVSYIIWFREIFINPNLFLNIITGKSGAVYYVRDNIKTIPGITTLSQCGVVFYIFYFHTLCGNIKGKLKKRHNIFAVMIFLLTLFRVTAWSERLALIEIVVPVALVIILHLRQVIKSINFNMITCIAPYLGVFLLFILFGFFEYFRSWLNFYQYTDKSFTHFVIDRVTLYYSTALNNGAGLLKFFYGEENGLHFSLNFIYSFPIIGDWLNGITPEIDYHRFLINYADQEFNNPSGIFTIFLDMSVIGGLIFGNVLGIFSGIIYYNFSRNHGVSIFLYPIIFLTIIEIFRIIYVSETRTFYIITFIFIGYIFFVKKLNVIR